MRRQLFDDVHEDFRASFRKFLEREVIGQEGRFGEWEEQRLIPHETLTRAGRDGFLGMAIPEEYGGAAAADFRFNAVIGEEAERAAVGSFGQCLTLHNDMCLPYLLRYGSEEQRSRWLPGVASGDLIMAIALTEPNVGSDLLAMTTAARREGDHYVVDGAKTMISNGINADLVILAVKTDPAGGADAISLLVVERGMNGFSRGRSLEKIGQHAHDTAELMFTDTRVPVANLLGKEGSGFQYLSLHLPQERLSIAASAVAAAEAALAETATYVKERKAFGQRLAALQTVRFTLAELYSEVEIARTFVDRCIQALNARELTIKDAATAKWWCTDLQSRVMDSCVQLHGGYGYMVEYPVARAFVNARATRIYGGANEVMKDLIGRSLGL
jgi:alkylation response protein AidB-like acyl-CoA dehydrogenase